ncbi:hypothetical protein SAMN04488109_0067 [Chryseolinea serpens]|uniref:PEP-CTERM protein-sorting domain-containing protein n=1 Tax=Chryseolinea serpens TaxID=947013 RepID=A0A1M5JJ72_9BACT|nr:hypothetical protein [Chryseolinea serpens]SHG40093.1 hypothetical protein SAMN04488109_0067 [Chryseolinea serpens]
MKVLLASISLLLLSTLLVNGQPGNPIPGNPVPITGLEYLLIGGGAYGVSRLLKKKDKNENAD